MRSFVPLDRIGPTMFGAVRSLTDRRSARRARPTHGQEPSTTLEEAPLHASPQISGAALNGASDRPRQRRKVWLVNQYAMTPDLPGINRHFELGWLLERFGWDATVFATAFHHTSAKYQRGVGLRRPIVWEKHNGVLFCWLYSTPYRINNWRRYVNMMSFMTTFVTFTLFAQRPDIVVGSSPHLLTGLGAWVAARRHRVPFLFEVRDVWPDMLVQLGLTSPVVVKPLTWLERFLYARADRVIALADGIAERIIAKGVPADKVVVIPNSLLPAPELDEERREARRKELNWENKVVAAWAGAHNPMNGLDVVVEAGRLLADDPEILIVFVGDGSLKQDLIEQARGLPNVIFYDPVPKTDIGDFLRAADIGLIHSRRFDAFTGTRPNKLFEYMSAGLPMVSTVPGETWRLIAEADAGIYTEWEDPQALATAIKTLAGDPERRRDLGRNGHAHVRAVHDRESHVARLAALLDTVAHESAALTPLRGAAPPTRSAPALATVTSDERL